MKSLCLYETLDAISCHTLTLDWSKEAKRASEAIRISPTSATVTPQVSTILEYRIMCEIFVCFCVQVLNFKCKIRGIFVILKNYKSLFAKKFNLGSKFNFVKGILENMLVIITWQLYCK